jgi:hypothetical protein
MQLACDGRQIALEDLKEIEKKQHQYETQIELFQNAKRIHTAMQSNPLLCSLFKKYKTKCLELLKKKKEEIFCLTELSSYCELIGDVSDIKRIQSELELIYSQLNYVEQNFEFEDATDDEVYEDDDEFYNEDEEEEEEEEEDEEEDEGEEEDEDEEEENSIFLMLAK